MNEKVMAKVKTYFGYIEEELESVLTTTRVSDFLTKIQVKHNLTDTKDLKHLDSLVRFYITYSDSFILRQGQFGGIVPVALVKEKKPKKSKSTEILEAKKEALEQVESKLRMAAKIAVEEDPIESMEEIEDDFFSSEENE